MEHLKYPIGQVNIPKIISENDIRNWISDIEKFPKKLETLVQQLSEEQLNTPYRDGGWTVKQTIHHCGDSHLHSYIRFKWALTEEQPIIKAYYEDRWAELFDTKDAPITLSLQFIKALHAKWVYLLKGLSKEDLDKEFIHPESGANVSLKKNIGLYAWHCNHHYAHIENLLLRNDWR